MADINQKITPSLWVEKDAKAVADYYLSIFKDGKLKDYRKFVNPPNEFSSDTTSFETAVIEIAGMEFSILAAGPLFKFNEAVSFVVNCKDQAEVDYYWEKLSAVPEAEQCGWLKDKYGLSWQIVPTAMDEMMKDKDEKKMARVTEAFLKMKKFDLAELKKAYEGT